VMDIINARSKRALVAANRGHEGGLSRKVKELRTKLRDLVVQLEAVIDYPEEDIEDVTYDKAIAVLTEGRDAVEKLVRQGSTGRILREGLRTAIVGRPNVGKSSLLNSLLQADRAIVSNIPGTTRDVIEEQMTINGIPLVLTDTAGLRDTEDYVEKIGVERSKAALEDAQLALVVLDGSQPLGAEDKALLDSLQDRPKLILVNKADLPVAVDTKALEDAYGRKNVIVLSVKTGEGMDQVAAWLQEFVYGEGSDSESGSMTQNARQQRLLEKALQSVDDALKGAQAHLPYDCLTIDLTEALHDLGEITGEDVPDEIIDEIFAQFCVGK
ncbi:MAG: tRNA uridine-5-carboxymethylaminomethyl(34) synthesis GTPase MnmE, partial [Acidaminococcus sp.]|nr:tRNA uridine-5-carboxymethylaminomethyl(34) synthesis GTPase MnmE [Acidaminococcus sp.]